MEKENDFEKMVLHALEVYRQIKELENGELKSLKAMLEEYKKRFVVEMKKRNLKSLDHAVGRVTFVEKETTKTDLEKIMQDLGVTELSKYESKEKMKPFVQFKVHPVKDEK
jgi:hypothetical protein